MVAIPSNFPISNNAEGAMLELAQIIKTAQIAAQVADPNIASILDTSRIDDLGETFTYGGVIKISSSTNPTNGKTEITAVSTF